MKRLKMIFTAIAVFAVVGAGLAFKAQKVSSVRIWTSTAANGCILVLAKTTTTTTTTPGQAQVFYTLEGPAQTNVTTTCEEKTFTQTTAD